MYIRCLEAPDVLQEDGVQDLLLWAIGSFCNQNERRVLILDTNSSTFSVGVTLPGLPRVCNPVFMDRNLRHG